MKKLLLLVPMVLFIIGCPKGTKDYYPLTVGNIWNYDMTMTTTLPDTTITGTGTMKIEITAETTLNNGANVFEEVSTSIVENSTHIDTSYTEETDDYILNYGDKADTDPDTMLVLPLEEGKTWKTDSNTTLKVIGKESVTVPAGTYDDCWKAQMIEENSDTIYVYLAPDIGLIKWHVTHTEDSLSYEMKIELKDATIN